MNALGDRSLDLTRLARTASVHNVERRQTCLELMS